MSVILGDCLDVMAGMDPESVDAIVTDPPYNLTADTAGWRGKTGDDFNGRPDLALRGGGFMGKTWDGTGVAFRRETWELAYRVAKPSAYLLAFGGTRTVHRMTCALEDAGWIIRDMLVWGYASGFPKSKASLKPAWEPIVMARKPGPLRMLAIDECRIPISDADRETWVGAGGYMKPDQPAIHSEFADFRQGVDRTAGTSPVALESGRWPANIVLSDELFEPGVPGVVIAGSLTGTMTAWSSSPDSEPSPTVSPARSADRRLSRSAPEVSSRGSATEHVGTQLDAWGMSTDTSRQDTGCSDGTREDGSDTSGSTDTSGSRPADPSPAATSSTTGTATGSTTTSLTSNSSPEPSTIESIGPSRPESSAIVAMPRPGAPEALSDDSANWRRSSPPVEEPSPGYSRFFLIPKAARSDREPVLGGQLPTKRWTDGRKQEDKDYPSLRGASERENSHPTVKPVDLMRHLVRLVTPTGGTVLDPFLGSGTTAIAAEMEGFEWIGIEREAEYVAIAEARLNGTQRGLGLGA